MWKLIESDGLNGLSTWVKVWKEMRTKTNVEHGGKKKKKSMCSSDIDGRYQ
jgi:hypothetical protein